MQRSSTIRALKIAHRYLGLFFAPAILFFAFTGALQTFGWHETTRGSSYVPARWIVKLAQIHKKQTLTLPAPKAKVPAADPGDAHSNPVKKSPGSKFALQCFVFAMSIGLAATTLLGIIMAMLYGGDRRIACGVVIAGILFPAAVLLF
jgi:hypothetical protein